MADGSIAIAITVDGKEVDVASKSLDGLGKQSQTTTRGIKDMVVSFGLVKVASAAFNVLKSSMSAAADRFDEFQKFPKVMDALGFSAEESKNSINKLSNGIEGLPTTLNDVTSQTRQLTAITGDLGKSTDTVLALNNAFLASGASSADASRGMIQYNQMLSKGTVDMQSWRSLQETMPLGLQKTAEAMGFVGQTAQQDLYKALQSGRVTFDQFNTEIIKLGTGTGELAKLAKTNSEGIGTSFQNLRNAAVKGLASMLDSLNKVSESATGRTIAKNLDGLKVVVNSSFKAINSSIELTAPLFKALFESMKLLIDVAGNSKPVIMGVGAAFATWKVIQTYNGILAKTTSLVWEAGMSGKSLSIVMKSVATAQEISSNATKADILLRQAQNGQLTIGTALIGVLTGSISASTVATTLMTAATAAFKVALDVLLGPVGLVLGAVTLLTAVFMKHKKEQKEAKEEAEKQTESYHELNKSIVNNRIEREKSIKSAENESRVNESLINSLSELYSKDKVSKSEKKDIAGIVDQLNQKYKDLNLSYNQETGYLNQSISLIREKAKVYAAQSKVSAYNEAINANLKEQIQLETQSKVIKDEIAKLEKQKNGDNYSQMTLINEKIKEHKSTLEETQKQERLSTNEYRVMQQDKASALNELAVAEQAAHEAIRIALENNTLTYDMLDKKQQETFDKMKAQNEALAESATNAFERIDTSSKISLGQMIENMKFNTEATRVWGENQSKLIAWAGQNGYEQFIPYIEKMGVDQSGVLAQMAAGVDASNTEQANLLATLAQTYQNGYATAGEAGKNALSTGLSGVSDSVYNMVIQPTTGLNTEVANSFSSMGKGASENLTSSLTVGSSAVKSASEALAGKVKEGFQLPLGITGSTSSEMENSGKAVVQGAKNGIENNKKLVTDASGIVAKDAIGKFNPMKSDAEDIGQQTMNGLKKGIEDYSPQALSAAERVANQVSEKMRKALEIHSPSRVMRDKVGRFIPEGVAVGINRYANKAYDAVNNLSEGLLKPIVPEFAAGAYNIGATSGISQVINNNYSNGNSNVLLEAINKLSNRPIVTNIDVDSTNVARATSRAVTQEQYYNERTDSRMRGILI